MKIDKLQFNTYLKAICFVLCFAVPISISAQKMTTTDVLHQLFSFQQQQLPFQKSLDFFNTDYKKLPFIQEVGIRTETNKMDFRQQEYLIRFKFSSKDERNSLNNQVIARKTKLKAQQQFFLHQKMYHYYEALVDLQIASNQLSLLIDQKLVLQDKQNVFKKMMQNQFDFDFTDWLNTQNDFLKIESDILKNNQIIKHSKEQLSVNEIDANDWISITDIQNVIQEIDSKNIHHPQLEVAKSEQLIAKADFKIEEADKQKWFNFAQIQYKADKKDPFGEELSIGAGIILPFKSNNSVKMNDAMLDIYKSDEKLVLSKQNTEEKIAIYKRELLDLILNFNLVNNHIQTLNLERTINNYQKNNALNPMELLNLKSSIFKNDEMIYVLKSKIFKTYIQLLFVSGALLHYPLQNYLSTNLNLY